MLRFDLTAYLSLLEAFDLTGRAMFPKDWTGTEAWANDSENPRAILERRQALFQDMDRLDEDISALGDRLRLELSDDELQQVSDKIGGLRARRKKLRAELSRQPTVSESWIKDRSAFERRISVEGELANAYEKEDLVILAGPGRLVPWRHWSQKPDFRVYYGLSMIRIPKGESALRRVPGLIERKAFGIWTERFDVSVDGSVLTPEAKLAEWLRAEVQANPHKTKSVVEYREEALALFSGLSARAFNRVWAQSVPEQWRQAGRMQRN